jgi:predicted bacteriocin transport accessory protein
MYAFKDGELIATLDNFVVDEENSISIKNRTINFIFENELFVNNHGIELITYEEVQEKRQNGEEFVLYVGRDTCSYCNVFMPSLVAVNEQLGQETTERTYKLYYLYTQSYKTAINNKVDGAQETWDALKEDLGIEGTPSVIYFKDGENVYMFKDYVDKEIKNNGTAEELEKAQEETAKHLMDWFNSLDTVQ